MISNEIVEEQNNLNQVKPTEETSSHKTGSGSSNSTHELESGDRLTAMLLTVPRLERRDASASFGDLSSLDAIIINNGLIPETSSECNNKNSNKVPNTSANDGNDNYIKIHNNVSRIMPKVYDEEWLNSENNLTNTNNTILPRSDSFY